MAETAERKHERVHLRLDAGSKRKLERAAAYEETTMSRFVVKSAVTAAERVIEARERIVLPATGLGRFPRDAARPARSERDIDAGRTALWRAPRWMSRYRRSSRSIRITTAWPSPVGSPRSITTFARQAPQDVRRRVARVFVAASDPPGRIVGYYTPSAVSFEKGDLPAELARRLPHYPVPAAVIGRLAVDLRSQGRGLGETMLLDAIRRISRASDTVGVYAIVVDALNDRTGAFYERYGFISISVEAAPSVLAACDV